jgi:hypothetical protein
MKTPQTGQKSEIRTTPLKYTRERWNVPNDNNPIPFGTSVVMCIFFTQFMLSTIVSLFTVKLFCFIFMLYTLYSDNFNSNNAFIILCLQPIAIAKIRKDFLADPIFDMNHMRNVSAATEKLCEWVMAIEEYDRMVKGSGGTVEESK